MPGPNKKAMIKEYKDICNAMIDAIAQNDQKCILQVKKDVTRFNRYHNHAPEGLGELHQMQKDIQEMLKKIAGDKQASHQTPDAAGLRRDLNAIVRKLTPNEPNAIQRAWSGFASWGNRVVNAVLSAKQQATEVLSDFSLDDIVSFPDFSELTEPENKVNQGALESTDKTKLQDALVSVGSNLHLDPNTPEAPSHLAVGFTGKDGSKQVVTFDLRLQSALNEEINVLRQLMRNMATKERISVALISRDQYEATMGLAKVKPGLITDRESEESKSQVGFSDALAVAVPVILAIGDVAMNKKQNKEKLPHPPIDTKAGQAVGEDIMEYAAVDPSSVIRGIDLAHTSSKLPNDELRRVQPTEKYVTEPSLQEKQPVQSVQQQSRELEPGEEYVTVHPLQEKQLDQPILQQPTSMHLEREEERKKVEAQKWAAANPHIISAMNKAISGTSGWLKLFLHKDDKSSKLWTILDEYSKATTVEDKKKQLIAFINLASKPREAFVWMAEFGYTKSAQAFYQALTDEATRNLIASAFGQTSLAAPQKNNQAMFVELITPASPEDEAAKENESRHQP